MNRYLSVALLLSGFFGLIGACKQGDRASTESAATTLARGEALAKVRCATCHAYPDPALLPQGTWEAYILPRMGYMLGIYPDDTTRNDLIEKGLAEEKVLAAGVFPEKAQISLEDWEAIQAFYLAKAPEDFPPYEIAAIEPDQKQFTLKIPDYRLSPPSSTMVHIARGGGLYVGDANSKAMYLFDKDLKLQKAANVKEGAVDIAEMDDRLLITVMGSFSPTDAASGFVFQLPTSPQLQPLVLMDKLQRPVHTAWGDLNGDKRLDAVISEFSKYTGTLGWWEQNADGQFQKHLLAKRPGATCSYLRDINQDGKMDIIALYGQGDEGIYAYLNDGKGQFREQSWLRFPPTYGSSFFTLYDFNADGHEDILYTCGDNADYPPVLKPYHGIRIYTNNGKNEFKESWFYPLHGAYKALPGDFDQDGDVDLAAIAFFPDFGKALPSSFVYLENQGQLQFKGSTFPAANLGRWITMETGDYDRDGDVDLVLGSLAFEVIPDRGEVARWVEKGLPFVVLENTKK
ncbi:MAG: FG-GAP-like repeat-containing protein [Haliscomenobacter sp.]|uniref:FG-GAP repeat domain-containing protein n=1 Tax=Haliscomenobacter sp. TaxID=2717303 RepID=UPI0029B0F49B|nr:FG-GAP-like repeat-containing protein [Haliscomenobacter sp.]MDX2071841.1 FG-GAP-like repeat-containing protein [Haliscomenobacter sp.]